MLPFLVIISLAKVAPVVCWQCAFADGLTPTRFRLQSYQKKSFLQARDSKSPRGLIAQRGHSQVAG